MLEAYLDRLAKEAVKGRSMREAEALLSEVREHLNDSIQARLELGSSLEEAERDAVAAFGAPQRVARSVSEAPPNGVKARMVCLTTYWCLFVPTLVWSAFSTRSMPETLVGVICGAFVATAVGFGLASFRSGRPAPGSVLRRSTLALLAGAGLLLATHVVYQPDDFPQFIGRPKAPGQVSEYRSMAAMARDGRLLDTTGRSSVALGAQYRRWSEELSFASDHPLSNILPTVHLACIFGSRLATLPLAFDLAFGSLGWLAGRSRRRRLTHG